jgi:hypothetical protein
VPAQSEDSAQQDRPLIELEVVRCDEPHAGGRPLFLTARRFIRICRAIERGESASEACRQQLTTYRNFRMHVARNPKYQRRLRQAEEVREHFLREFHIANVTKHSVKNVLASLWWLERRYPNEFALKTVICDTGDSREPAVFDKISLEQLIENARIAAEIAANPPSGLVQAPELTEGKSDEGLARGLRCAPDLCKIRC